MNRLVIKEPIWKDRCVGIADHRVGCKDDDELLVGISYRTKDGAKLYPDTYIISRREINEYPTKPLWNGMVLRLVPIDKLRIHTRARKPRPKVKTTKVKHELQQDTLF